MTDMTTIYPDGAYWSRPLDCGHLPTPPTHFHSTGVPFTNGAARNIETNRTSCYECAHASEAQRLADPATTRFGGYIGSDGSTFTSWPGGTLGRVLTHGVGRNGLHYYTVRTPDGRRWHGSNGGPGMALTIRAYKRQH